MYRYLQLLLRTAFVLSLVAIGPAYAGAQTPAVWGELEAGPHAVGFKFVYQQDFSRNWRASEEAGGYPRSEARGRPVRIGVWYPARLRRNDSKLLYREYMPTAARAAVFSDLNQLLERRDAGNLRANLKADEFDVVMTTRTRAVANAVPEKGPFPLLVYSAGLNNGSHDNFVLCEYLASHGYVVVTVAQLGTTSLDVNLKFPSAADLETQILDLQFAVGATRDLPGVDRGRLGAIGYSVGGVAALNFVLRNDDVDALVTLDPTFGVAPFVKLATDSPYFQPTRMRAPWLYLYRTEPATSLTVFDQLRYANRYALELAEMTHQDFSSAPMLSARAAAARPGAPDAGRRGYQTICRYVVNFFDAELKKSARGSEFISRDARENGAAGIVAKREFRSAARVPPTEGKFLKIFEEQGFERAVGLYKTLSSENPGQPIYSENFLNGLGYRLVGGKRLAQAVEIFTLNVEAYPASANAYDSLGEAHLLNGNKELAIEYYERSVELNPKNQSGIDALKKLKGVP